MSVQMAGPLGIPCVRMPIDSSTGHSPCFPPTRPATGSITTFTDQFAQVRISDSWVTHCCMGSCHAPVTVQGSTNTFADQLAKQRIGDAMGCGDAAATGSLDTLAG